MTPPDHTLAGSEPTHQRISLQMMDESARDKLRDLFDDLEKKLEIEGLGVTLFTVIMELVGNAVKANLKRAYFKRHDFQMNDPVNYQQGVDAFKKDYENIRKEEYKRALEDLKLVVTVEIDLDHERLLTYVENNTIMQNQEESRVRTKLAEAMKANELLDFYLHYGDDMEGSGIGLAMIVFLIKQIGFDPNNFRVFHRGEKTIARIEFPLNKSYIPIRDRHKSTGFPI